MNLITCVSAVVPCPEVDQRLMSLNDALDPASLGITPESILFAFAWGMAAVLTFWVLGIAANAALSAINKM